MMLNRTGPVVRVLPHRIDGPDRWGHPAPWGWCAGVPYWGTASPPLLLLLLLLDAWQVLLDDWVSL